MPEKQLKGLIHQSLWYNTSFLVGQPSGMMLQSVAYGSTVVLSKLQSWVVVLTHCHYLNTSYRLNLYSLTL